MQVESHSFALAIGRSVRDRTRTGRDAASAPSDREGEKKAKDQVCDVVAWEKGKIHGG